MFPNDNASLAKSNQLLKCPFLTSARSTCQRVCQETGHRATSKIIVVTNQSRRQKVTNERTQMSEFKGGATSTRPPSAFEAAEHILAFYSEPKAQTGENESLPDFSIGAAVAANSPAACTNPHSLRDGEAQRDRRTIRPSLRRAAARSHWEHLCHRGRTCCHGLLGQSGVGGRGCGAV